MSNCKNPSAASRQSRIDAPKLLPPSAVREALALAPGSKGVLRGLEARGALVPIRLGPKTLRYRAADLEALVKSGGA